MWAWSVSWPDGPPWPRMVLAEERERGLCWALLGSSVSREDAAGDVGEEPVDAGQQVLAGEGAAALDAPVVAADGVQLQGLWCGERR